MMTVVIQIVIYYAAVVTSKIQGEIISIVFCHCVKNYFGFDGNDSGECEYFLKTKAIRN